jgi:hypothetical protein
MLTGVIECAYFASMRDEESRPTVCTLAFADPENPDPKPPPYIRYHLQRFSRFAATLPLTVRNLAKLAPIALTSSLAIAIYGDARRTPFIWGLVDQELHHRRARVFEEDGSFGRAGRFEVEVLGVGHVGAYTRSVFVGALRGNQISTLRLDALRDGPIFDILFASALDAFLDTARDLGTPFDDEKSDEHMSLFMDSIDTWIGSLCRILHRVQRYNHGGALLLLPDRKKPDLKIKHSLNYARLSET